MADSVVCHLLFCKNPECGRPMKLPTETLLPLLVDPEDPSIRASAIAVLCHHCMKIESYSLRPDSPDWCAAHLVALDRISGVGRTTWLRCEEGSCKARLPLVSVWSPAIAYTPPETSAEKAFPWHDLKCPNGHAIPFPQN